MSASAPAASALRLRPATTDDAGRVFAWRNDPWIIARGASGAAVSWEAHASWFAETVAGERRRMFIVLEDETPIGQVRFDRIAGRGCEVSIYLVREHTGRGLGVQALDTAVAEIFRTWDVDAVVAWVRRDNPASLAAFEKAAFQRTRGEDRAGHVALRRGRPLLVPHNRLTLGEAEVRAAAEAVASAQWAGGPRVAALERRLSRRAGVAQAVGVASGLAALRLALKGLGVQRGDEVIVPAYACVALANAILALGATPVAADVTPGDWNLDPRSAAAVRTSRSRAVIAVNTFGAPADVAGCRALGVPVIEDCAHGFGLAVAGGVLGGRADVAVSSFHATKLLGAGEGGAILTDRAELAAFVRDWRDYGDEPPDGTRLNDKLSDIHAAVALSQLDRLDAMIAARADRARRYHARLAEAARRSGTWALPAPSPDRVWYRYTIELADRPAVPVIEELRRRGIGTACPVTDWRQAGGPACPVADRAYARLLSLPLYPTLSEDEQERVCAALEAVLGVGAGG
jgi:perosamine synthetase